jgi:hypothetical protein
LWSKSAGRKPLFSCLSALWTASAAEMDHSRRERCRLDPVVAGCNLGDLKHQQTART